MSQKANCRAAAEKIVHKKEAGAIAFVVAQTIGLSTGRSHIFSARIVQCEIGAHIHVLSDILSQRVTITTR
jgi:hypothetical protein